MSASPSSSFNIHLVGNSAYFNSLCLVGICLIVSKESIAKNRYKVKAVNGWKPNSALLEFATANVRLFSYNSLRSATSDFHPSNRIGSRSKYIALDWPKRAAICLGTASGIAFLHYEAVPRIVHRDIKASNILLDGDFHPKIGDFGLAKLFPDNVTHLSTRVAGTVGYLAPEYALLGQLTKKADVYSFGVLILEIVSGKSSTKAAFGVELMLLVEWTWKLKQEERLLDIVDPELTEYPEDEVLRFIKVALFCTQASAHQRPTMNQVVHMLSKDVHLNDKLLTEAGVYKGYRRTSSELTSSSLKTKGKQSMEPSSSTNIVSSHSITEMLPR
ncbi:hypothetical protein GOBAR_DD00595 [Gossypium barbadense]|nr:hypothetical protein GOBAR_DD00595 [Gossypium barbadense]